MSNKNKTLIFVSVIVILVICIYHINNKQENFDTYRNHNDFAIDYYIKNDPKLFKKNLTYNETDLYSKYMWNEKDKKGLKIYDHYYEKINNDNNYKTNKKSYNYQFLKPEVPHIFVNGMKISLS